MLKKTVIRARDFLYTERQSASRDSCGLYNHCYGKEEDG